MNKPVDEFKNRFNYAITLRNIKPIELSEMTGISKSTISHYMSGYTKPKSGKLFLLAKALNVNEAWLMGIDVPMERNAIIENSQQTLTQKDERDIKRDLESLREKLTNKELGPAAYDGEDIPDDDIDLFLGQVDLMLRRVKSRNKERFNPHKNKK